MTTNISPRDWEALSAYLDGQLAPKERQNLEARLQARADLRAALDELRRTREVVRARLPVRAPRNFTLTPEMAGIRKPSRPAMTLFPAMRLASALSSLLFVLVALGEIFMSGPLSAARQVAVEQKRAAAPLSAAQATQAPAATAAAAPPAAQPEVAQEAAPPTAVAIAAAAPPASPTPLPELAQPIPPETETVQMQPGGVGAGGAGGEDQADQAALSKMAAAATATPLPTTTPTPSVTPQPSPTPEQLALQNAPATEQARVSRSPGWTTWRWVEAFLAFVGVSTGLIALYLHRAGQA